MTRASILTRTNRLSKNGGFPPLPILSNGGAALPSWPGRQHRLSRCPATGASA